MVTSEGALAPVRPLPIAIRYPGGRVPACLSVDLDGSRTRLEVDRVDGEVGRVMLPVWANSSRELHDARGVGGRSSPSGGAAPAPV